MPTLEDWLSLELDEEDRTFIGRLSQLRPEWIGTGDLEERILVRFNSPLDGELPVILELEDLTLFWGDWHEHLYLIAYSWPAVDPTTVAVGKIEAILSGWYVRIKALGPLAELQWVGSALMPGEQARFHVEKLLESGHEFEMVRWPGTVVDRSIEITAEPLQ